MIEKLNLQILKTHICQKANYNHISPAIIDLTGASRCLISSPHDSFLHFSGCKAKKKKSSREAWVCVKLCSLSAIQSWGRNIVSFASVWGCHCPFAVPFTQSPHSDCEIILSWTRNNHACFDKFVMTATDYASRKISHIMLRIKNVISLLRLPKLPKLWLK